MKPESPTRPRGSRARPTPLRRSLFLRFALLVSSALLLFGLGYLKFGLEPVIDRFAVSDFRAAVDTSEASLDALFAPAERWVRVARRWAVVAPFDERRPDDFNRLFEPMLAEVPHFTSVVAGTDRGLGWMLLERPGGGWTNRFTNLPARGREQIFIDRAADGTRHVRHELKDYDPRTRPWFHGARAGGADGGVYWTAPYRFFTTGDPGMTAASGVSLPDGSFMALGIDIKLIDVTRATAAITVGERGFALVMTDAGELLGLPRIARAADDDAIRAHVLKPVSALGSQVVDAGVAAWERQRRPDGTVLRYVADGVPWLASFSASHRGGQTLWVGVFAPSADFVPAWKPLAQALLVIFIGVLGLSFLLALRYTRRVSAPLESLAADSARIAQLDFHETPPVQSDILEIRQLAGAQDRMRGMLLDYRKTVDAQAQSLREQIVALQSAETRLAHLSQHDPLTGLPNRLLFHERLAAALQRAERHDARVALLFLDLDRFKGVNDSEGHPVGDRLLCLVAERLSGALRRSDTLARLGGDEFIVLAEDIDDEADAESLARKLLATLETPFEIASRTFHLTGSIGISLYPSDGTEGVALIRNADSAMYQAKTQGRNTFRFYSADMTQRAVARLELEESLRVALDHGEFELHYQPQVALDDGRLLGVEALLRWRHPEQGLVMPDAFVALAEETGLIVRIGDWALEAACRQWAEWARQGLVLDRVAVNLSVKQLQKDRLAAQLARVLGDTGVPAGVLELEITESVLLETPEAQDTLSQIGSAGISFALDDFGTGCSSLSYLKKLPLARLKIDRGFTWDIGKHADGEAVVRAIIGLAQALGREVIAEGVETREQAEFLLRHGCGQAQGYHYARPMDAAALAAWWAARRD